MYINTQISMSKSKKRVALVIGSGAIKCAASIGMFQVLKEENIEIDLVVGCSGGAIYGVGIAAGMDPVEIQDLSDSTWTKDLMQGYLVNLKASKDGTLKFNERSGLVDNFLTLPVYSTFSCMTNRSPSSSRTSRAVSRLL